MDFNQIQEIIRMVSKHKLTEFILKEGDFKLVVRNQPAGEGGGTPIIVPSAQPVVAMTPAFAPPVQQPASPAPAPAAPAASEAKPAAAPAAGGAVDPNQIQIKSPMVGTFYRSTAPDKPPFIKVGDVIEVGTKVCIIEAMKLFNEIESEVKGRVVKILVDDAKPVEYDQPLFLLEPA